MSKTLYFSAASTRIMIVHALSASANPVMSAAWSRNPLHETRSENPSNIVVSHEIVYSVLEMPQ